MAWELEFMQWANERWGVPLLDRVIPWLTHLGSHIAVIFFVLLVWALARRRKVLGRLALLYGIESAVVYSIKFLVHRERPPFFRAMASRFTTSPGEILDPSFPSAHTVYAFMMATLLSARFPRYRALFYVAAGLTGWTRLYLGVHFPTDVVGGALLGYGITRLFLLKGGIPSFGNRDPSLF
jgi:undecaprenyl-diphosphatase